MTSPANRRLRAQRAPYALGLGLLACLVGSCQSYNQRTRVALAEFRGGRFEEAMLAYAEDADTGSVFLSGAEAGTAALVAGDWERSLEYYHLAARDVRLIEQQALISPERAAEGLLSWAINDTFKTYNGEGYERVMLHASLGLAYLALGAVDDVMVEVRLANALLESEEKLYATEYRAGGLGHFLSAVGYELTGRLDDAYIDYQRMQRKGVGGRLVGLSLVRLAGDLGRYEDQRRWEVQYGPAPLRPPDAARVIVIAGVGLGPYKEEASLVIPTGSGVLSWAVPEMVGRYQPVSGLELEVSGARVSTSLLEDVGQVARKNLDDRLAWLAAKSAVRAVLKRELTQHLYREYGGWGALAGNLYSILTERADLRAWTTLPNTWHACRMFAAPGRLDLGLRAVGGERVHLGVFEVAPGETMFVLARTIGTRLYAHVIGGQPVPATEVTAQSESGTPANSTLQLEASTP